MRLFALVAIAAISFNSGFAQKLSGKDKKAIKRVTAHVTYLASDDLTGRATGTSGEALSADYIANEFKRNKLIPKGSDGYFQPFQITTLRVADTKSIFKVNGLPLPMFEAYYPLSYSCNTASYSGETVDVSFGIVNEKRDDYKGKTVTGKYVWINLGSPDGIHPHSAYLAWHGVKIRVDEAIKQGAKGVLFYRTSDAVSKPDGELSLRMTPSTIPVLFVDNGEEFSVVEPGIEVDLKVIAIEETGHNVVGFKDNGAEYTVVIGAHHDHLGQGQHGNSLAENPNEVHNGADDNASGTAALFELSKALKKAKKWSKSNNYLFIAFSGEELGLLGSKYFVANPTIDLRKVNYMINMDMIGMLNDSGALAINGVGTSPVFESAIDHATTETFGINSVAKGQSGIGPSDHTSFYLQGIPSIHYFTGAHEHYHKPSDDVENLNFPGEIYVINHIKELVEHINDLGKIEYQETKDDRDQEGKSRTKFAVTLGIVPNYVFDGEGMQIDAVREGKPGAEAGLQAKDVVISFAGKSIKTMMDYMSALKEIKAGDQVNVTVIRDGKTLNLTVQF